MLRLYCVAALLPLFGCGGERVVGSLSQEAVPNCDPSYTQATRIQIDGRPYAENLTDFPVLISLSTETFDFDGAGPNGEGLSLVTSDCTVLAHEVDSWDSAGSGALWVRVPVIEAGSQPSIFLFSGQNTPTNTSQPNEVFNESYAAVYHLEGDSLADASSFRRRASNRGSSISSGQIGEGRAFVRDTGISIPDSSFSGGNDPRTACVWASSNDDGAAFFWMFTHGTGDHPAGGFGLNRHATILECLGSDGSRVTAPGIFPNGDRSWHYVCCSYDGTESALYADGTLLTTEPDDWPLTLGTGQLGSPVGAGPGDGSWAGTLDELRVSRRAQSADWIAAEHASMTGAMVTLQSAPVGR